MKIAYALRTDANLAAMQEASLSNSSMGIRPVPAVVGSEEWWQAIAAGSLQLHTVTGVVRRFVYGHHGDFPEFEMCANDGSLSTWGCFIDADEAQKVYAVGRSVQVDYVDVEAKADVDPRFKFHKLPVEIRVDALP